MRVRMFGTVSVRFTETIVMAGVALGVAGLALAGCSAAGGKPPSADSSEPAIGAIPVISDITGLNLPLQDYLLTEQKMRRLDQARVLLIDRCMQGFGFRYLVRGRRRRSSIGCARQATT